MQDVRDWVELHRILHNDHPHLSLGYVLPNEEHAEHCDRIHKARKDNLKLARQVRLKYYYQSKDAAMQKTTISGSELLCNSFAAL